MKKYIFQLVVEDERYNPSLCWPAIFTEAVQAKDDGEAYDKLLDWTWTVYPHPSDEADRFEMLINGLSACAFLCRMQGLE